jgi:hypothetical protein
MSSSPLLFANRRGDYCDLPDVPYRKNDTRNGQKTDRDWKENFLTATNVPDKDYNLMKTDPLRMQYDLD